MDLSTKTLQESTVDAGLKEMASPEMGSQRDTGSDGDGTHVMFSLKVEAIVELGDEVT